MSVEINEILENVLHWDTCPEDYKVTIRKHLEANQLKEVDSFKNSPVHDKAAIVGIIDEFHPDKMVKLVDFLQELSMQQANQPKEKPQQQSVEGLITNKTKELYPNGTKDFGNDVYDEDCAIHFQKGAEWMANTINQDKDWKRVGELANEITKIVRNETIPDKTLG